jgi:NAD(P)-dependent dehydrogenase (short-subunit alcohol dehydrogenase family)
MQLQGTVIIVTGAGGEIGAPVACALALGGAKIVVAEASAAAGEPVAAAIRAFGGQALFVPCDVYDRNEVNGMLQTAIRTYQQVDALVSATGVRLSSALGGTETGDQVPRVVIELDGIAETAGACIPHLPRDRPGSVLIIATVHTEAGPSADLPPEADPLSPRAQEVGQLAAASLVAVLGQQHVRDGVLIHGIARRPGETWVWRAAPGRTAVVDARQRRWGANLKIDRAIKPAEIGLVAAFLITGQASYADVVGLRVSPSSASRRARRESLRRRDLPWDE